MTVCIDNLSTGFFAKFRTCLHTCSVALILLCSGLIGGASAEPIRITASEIHEALEGNTVLGTWKGDLYKQYFQENGTTIYAPKRSQSTLGKWRVNESTEQYESEWTQGRWAGYGVLREGEQYYWSSPNLAPQPFIILEGEQLVWEIQ